VGHDHAGRQAEGGRQFGRVEHGQPAGGAAAGVVDPAAGADPAHRLVDHGGQRGQRPADGRGDQGVLVVEPAQQAKRGQHVQVERPAVTLLGRRNRHAGR
jgi:hypothetical protein